MWNDRKPAARVESAANLRGVYLYTPYDAFFVAQLKDAVPAELRQWDGDNKRWYVFESHAEAAVRIARAYWPDIDLSRYGTAQEQGWRRTYQRGGQRQQSSSRGSYREPWSNASAPASDHATLYVTIDAPPEVVRAAYKALAIKHHPDKGGDSQTMQRVNGAFDRLKKAGKA
jgi:hypothetical protein